MGRGEGVGIVEENSVMKYYIIIPLLLLQFAACENSTTKEDSTGRPKPWWSSKKSSNDSQTNVMKEPHQQHVLEKGELDCKQNMNQLFKDLDLDSEGDYYTDVEYQEKFHLECDHVDYLELNGQKKAYAFYAHSGGDCHACPGKASVAVFKQNSGDWELEKFEREFECSGSNGSPNIPELKMLWDKIPFFIEKSGYMATGVLSESLTIISVQDLKPILSYSLGVDGSGTGEKIFSSYEVKEDFYEQDGKFLLKLKYDGVDVERKGEKLVQIPREEEVNYQYLPDKRKFIKL